MALGLLSVGARPTLASYNCRTCLTCLQGLAAAQILTCCRQLRSGWTCYVIVHVLLVLKRIS